MSSVPSRAGGFALDRDQIQRLISEIGTIRDQVSARFVADDDVRVVAPGHDATSQQAAAFITSANRDRATYGKLVVDACDNQLTLLRDALRDYGTTEEANTMRT